MDFHASLKIFKLKYFEHIRCVSVKKCYKINVHVILFLMLLHAVECHYFGFGDGTVNCLVVYND